MFSVSFEYDSGIDGFGSLLVEHYGVEVEFLDFHVVHDESGGVQEDLYDGVDVGWWLTSVAFEYGVCFDFGYHFFGVCFCYWGDSEGDVSEYFDEDAAEAEHEGWSELWVFGGAYDDFG